MGNAQLQLCLCPQQPYFSPMPSNDIWERMAAVSATLQQLKPFLNKVNCKDIASIMEVFAMFFEDVKQNSLINWYNTAFDRLNNIQMGPCCSA